MKTLRQTGFMLALALLTFACGNSGETVKATDAKEVAQIEGSTLNIETAESTITWKGYKPTGQHTGIIPAVEGSLALNGDQVTGGKITFDITKLEIHDLEAGSEDHGKLSGHLQSEDFFDAANHPVATFEITSVEPYIEGQTVADKEEFSSDNTPSSDSEITPANPNVWISGNLTMRGNTKNIKFPANVNFSNGAVTAKAGFNINRTDWGLAYGDEASATDKAKDKFIYNTVSIILDVKAD